MLFSALRRASRFFPLASSGSSSSSESEVFVKTTEQITSNVLKLEKRFVDSTEILVKSGNGGNGCYTFMQPRGFRSKIASGGDGGKGGDVYMVADSSKNSLIIMKTFIAENGENGQGKDMNGAGGKDMFISVPLGTIVKEVNKLGKSRTLGILNTEGKLLIAQGGKGGRGNRSTPEITEHEKGEEGKTKKLQLELKLIADIGFVGYPNAGKTSLLASLTRACPKIASYPFTTLKPYIGILEFIDGKRISIADMPGIIEGASEGKGLGFEFLRHIQRTKGIVYVLDITDEPEKALKTLYNELALYDKKLVAKPYAIALNKADLLSDAKDVEAAFDNKAAVISAKHGTGLNELVRQMKEIVKMFE